MPNIVRFDCFEVDLESGQLRRGGVRVRLRDQAFQVLAALLQHPGEVVTREAFRKQLWHEDVFVDFDNNLNIVVARLREALGDSAEHPSFIETLPKRGYRFLAPLSPTTRTEVVPAPRPRLIVLPFLSLGDGTQGHLNDAITDEMITELASLAPDHLAVIARTTSMFYKHVPKNVAAIGRDLGVAYVVEGSIRRADDVIGINVQLIQTRDQTHLFARSYDTTVQQVFSLQNHIAHELALHIPEVSELVRTGGPFSAIRRPSKPTGDLAAYSEYLQGRFYLGQATWETSTIAKAHLDKAIARDPEFALAHDALAELYWYRGYIGFVAPQEAFSAGIVHALRAIEIDNTLAETHALVGAFHKTLEYNWPEVHRELAIALQIEPRSPLVRMRYAICELMPHARLDQAIAELEHALELDPLSFLGRAWMGIMLVLARRFEEAMEEGKRLLDFDPNYYMAFFLIGCGYRYLGKAEEAITAQRKAVELSGDTAWMLGWLGLTLGSTGDTRGASTVLSQLRNMQMKGYVPPSSFALVHLGLKQLDIAFEWLNRAVDERDQLMMPIKSYAFFDPIRNDPRFLTLLRKMNLEP